MPGLAGNGRSEGADVAARNVRLGPEGATFEVVERGAVLGAAPLPVGGIHNVENALGVVAAARGPGLGFDEIAPGLGAFQGVRHAPGQPSDRPGVDTLLVAGCTTSGCVLATVIDGFNYGYRTVVVEECVFDRAETPDRVSLFDMDAKYADVLSLAEVEDWLTQRMVRGEAPPPGA